MHACDPPKSALKAAILPYGAGYACMERRRCAIDGWRKSCEATNIPQTWRNATFWSMERHGATLCGETWCKMSCFS